MILIVSTSFSIPTDMGGLELDYYRRFPSATYHSLTQSETITRAKHLEGKGDLLFFLTDSDLVSLWSVVHRLLLEVNTYSSLSHYFITEPNTTLFSLDIWGKTSTVDKRHRQINTLFQLAP